ncbi:hypothetical protein M595_3464 [Lyngbya aestuarii BL J]|uniref:Uncharacterized protein n=1 Tax=Lyngbya aestuarii BL J TaxID=1348334 RepID=U7QHK4_9CYAN|nr:hypothetical protein M595_3464 [Lyngbya aestuarii BL J]
MQLKPVKNFCFSIETDSYFLVISGFVKKNDLIRDGLHFGD